MCLSDVLLTLTCFTIKTPDRNQIIENQNYVKHILEIVESDYLVDVDNG